MLMSIIMMIMMLSIVSCFTFAQETPAAADKEKTAQTVEKEKTPEEKPAAAAPAEAAPAAPQETKEKPAAPEAAEKPAEKPAEKIAEKPEQPKEKAAEQPAPSKETEKPSEEKPTPAAAEKPIEKPSEEKPAEQPAPQEAAPKPEEKTKEQPPVAPEKKEVIAPPAEMRPTEIAAPAPPIPVEEQEIFIPENMTEPEEEAPAGIDTVSLEHPQGNWLFKRIWWERAEERYEKIRTLVDAIWESRNKFFIERNTLDRKILDPFYISIGIDQGELQIILSEINEFFEKQREQEGALTEEERMLYESYTTEEDTLKQLKADVEAIAKLDQEIDNALGTLMDQINRVRNFESQAWNNFKEIAHILNDTRARELYYMIEGAARNIKNISNYLEQEFFSHFNTLVGDAKNRVTRVHTQIEALKEKGIKFQRQTQLLEEQAQQQAPEQEEEEVKPKPKLGWFDWITSGVSSVFEYIWSIIRLPYDLIFGK